MEHKYPQFELDCAIFRAKISAEMHNWFVIMREYHKTSDELQQRYVEICDGPQEHKDKVVEAANTRLREEKERQERYKATMMKDISEGKYVSDIQRIIAGIPPNDTHEPANGE